MQSPVRVKASPRIWDATAYRPTAVAQPDAQNYSATTNTNADLPQLDLVIGMRTTYPYKAPLSGVLISTSVPPCDPS